MARRFRRLRGAMAGMDVDGRYLGELLSLHPSTVSLRLTGQQPWTLTEQYKIMDELNIPYDQMHKYFPKNGMEKE